MGGSLYVSGLRNLTSALRTTGLLPNYTAEHHMIHVSSSPVPSAPSWLVWHNKPEWKWLAGCNQGRPLGSTIAKHGAPRAAAGALLNHCSPALQHRKLHFKTNRLGCSPISQWSWRKVENSSWVHYRCIFKFPGEVWKLELALGPLLFLFFPSLLFPFGLINFGDWLAQFYQVGSDESFISSKQLWEIAGQAGSELQ